MVSRSPAQTPENASSNEKPIPFRPFIDLAISAAFAEIARHR
jgi:hypothetical protein